MVGGRGVYSFADERRQERGANDVNMVVSTSTDNLITFNVVTILVAKLIWGSTSGIKSTIDSH